MLCAGAAFYTDSVLLTRKLYLLILIANAGGFGGCRKFYEDG